MNSNIMDPELAPEMVKFLAQELKTTRARNSALEEDNTILQKRIARLQDELTRTSPVKSEEALRDLQYAEMPTSHMSGESARLPAESEDLVREKEKASRTQVKLSNLQEKYKLSKGKVRKYKEMLNELRAALSERAKELEQGSKAVVAEVNSKVFLKGLPYEPVEGQLRFSSIRPSTREVHIELYKGVVGVRQRLCFINCHEVLWSASGIALGLVIKPTFQYNPKTYGGTWTKLEDSLDVGTQMDLCCLSGKKCRYLGTYERMADQDTMVIASEALKHLDKKKLDYASKRTTLFPDLVPPSQTQMIKNMYRHGVIKLQCFVIRCVAVNQTFTEKLRDASAQQNPSYATVIPTPADNRGNVLKRKRDQGSANQAKNKKRYEPLHAA